MEPIENIKVSVIPGENGQVTIRQGEALPLHEPKILNISGLITAPRDFLNVRKHLLNIFACNLRVTVNQKISKLTLTVGESDHYAGTVTGSLVVDESLLEFGINTGKKWSLVELSNFIKMRRFAFLDTSAAMALVSELRNFKAKVNKEFEKVSDNRGNKNDVLTQVVNTNIPESFLLRSRIYKNDTPVTFQVDINIVVREAEMECYLESYELAEIMKQRADEAVTAQVMKISNEFPELFIYTE